MLVCKHNTLNETPFLGIKYKQLNYSIFYIACILTEILVYRFSKVTSALVVAVEGCEQKTKLVTSDIPEVSEENIPPPRRGRCTWMYNVVLLNDQ